MPDADPDLAVANFNLGHVSAVLPGLLHAQLKSNAETYAAGL